MARRSPVQSVHVLPTRSASEPPVTTPSEEPAWKQRAVERSIKTAKLRAAQRVQRFLDAAQAIIIEKGSTDFTVQEVVDSGGTALAVPAEPTLGQAGYWMMTVTALFATAGATNSGLYPATGLADEMATRGQFPPAMGARVGGRASTGIVTTAIAAIVLAVFFDLNAIASIGSAVALVVFALVTLGHLRIRQETGANLWVLLVADLTTVVVLVSFTVTTLVDEPGTLMALLIILALSVALDLIWKSRRPDPARAP